MKLHVNEEFSFKIKTILKKGIFYTLLLSGFMYGSYKSGKDYCDEHPEYRYEDTSNNNYNEDTSNNDYNEEVEHVDKIDESIGDAIIEEIKTIEGVFKTLNSNLIKEDKRKVVAITFDDGPGIYTDRLLDILKENDAKATFFVLGKNVKSNPDSVKRAYDEGHEIGIHGYDHQYYTDLGVEETRKQIVKTYNILREIDVEPSQYIRPPGQFFNDELVENLNYASIIWSVDTKDWLSRDKEQIKQLIRDNIQEGSIILLHDIHECSVDAVEEILPELIKEYRFVTIDKLFNILDNDLEICNVYRNAKVKEKQLSY